MNLHIFGHSIAMRAVQQSDPPKFPTFADQLMQKYSVPVECHHAVSQGSEERILYYLKKAKDIDIALIFHGNHRSFFCPTWNNDLRYINSKDFWDGEACGYVQYMPSIIHDSFTMKHEPIILSKQHYRPLYNCFTEHFYTHDLNKNRFYGALMQIDQYLKHKNIPAIHCTLKNTIPTWFEFSQGIVDTELAQLQHSGEYACSHHISANAMTQEGNAYFVETLSGYIDSLVEQRA